MTQSWNPTVYAEIGAFVPTLGAGVLEWLDPKPGERILDLGCGDGQLTAKIVAAGREASPVVHARFCQCAGSRLPWKQAMTVSVASSWITNINA